MECILGIHLFIQVILNLNTKTDLCCIAVSEGFAALAFTGVEVNMVLFSKSVLRQTNADAAKTFSTWMGTLNICTLLGAFLSDSYLGRYLTCVVFQGVLVIVSPLDFVHFDSSLRIRTV